MDNCHWLHLHNTATLSNETLVFLLPNWLPLYIFDCLSDTNNCVNRHNWAAFQLQLHSMTVFQSTRRWPSCLFSCSLFGNSNIDQCVYISVLLKANRLFGWFFIRSPRQERSHLVEVRALVGGGEQCRYCTSTADSSLFLSIDCVFLSACPCVLLPSSRDYI